MHSDPRGPDFNRKRLYVKNSMPGNVFSRVLAFVATVVLAGIAFMFSIVVFALIVAVGAIAWGYFWWKTRELRKHLREQADAANGYRPPPRGEVLEGEVIREIRPEEEDGNFRR